MEGAPLSPVSPNPNSPRSPLWDSQAQEMEKNIDKYSKSVWGWMCVNTIELKDFQTVSKSTRELSHFCYICLVEISCIIDIYVIPLFCFCYLVIFVVIFHYVCFGKVPRFNSVTTEFGSREWEGDPPCALARHNQTFLYCSEQCCQVPVGHTSRSQSYYWSTGPLPHFQARLIMLTVQYMASGETSMYCFRKINCLE